ncbi:hypothetical protein M501DRAFT_1011857 [Patellaria atrata CBS 101060]|uniref:Peptidyl-prolyl cis-trans isomerase-like 2 n=1 Tax=Patellaria atrata CBS 101060 TaxID=1346257 RepID=A0A9P4VM67_9PEZI|nr:hypothetical protein M501DRAFT_1011857 [Patellaria atrata CBS 101060]
MGKGTDKLYITHSEWSSSDAYSASKGSNVSKSSAPDASFKRLPFNFCAVSLQPFKNPVCTSTGTIFDIENIVSWLQKHHTNPVDGKPLKSPELIKLNFSKNDDGEYVDPVTYKVFTDNTHIVALRNTGNVFSWDTVERLNIKARNWRDLVTDDEFTRTDIITLQDPQNVGSRDLSSFKYLKDGEGAHSAEAKDTSNVNATALGNAGKIIKAKEAVAKARAERAAQKDPNRTLTTTRKTTAGSNGASKPQSQKPLPYNAAQYTTGLAAASFTSTGVTPHTSAERATLTDEEYMLKPRRVKNKGYARLSTSHGELTVELLPEFAPKAVWNFVRLAQLGKYRDIAFHRNIPNFMIQGGDPTGTGRGGQSVWGAPFADELEGPRVHEGRGVLSMANKGKDTNTSQFFVTYRTAPHLNRKHTIFGRVVGGLETLDRLEKVETDEKNRPTGRYPFEEFLKMREESEGREREREEVGRLGGTEDDRVTWTGKRIRLDGTVEEKRGAETVGRYLKEALAKRAQGEDEIVGEEGRYEEPAKKKAKMGFGNFDNW